MATVEDIRRVGVEAFRDKEEGQAFACRVAEDRLQIDNFIGNEDIAQDLVAKVEGKVQKAEVPGHNIDRRKLFRPETGD